MGLVIIAPESTVRDKVFAKYRNVAAFSLSKSLTGTTVDDREIEYEKLSFLPDDDTINGIKNGDLSLKKVIEKGVKAIRKPNPKKTDRAIVGLGVAQLITLITSRRKSRRGEIVVAFIEDEGDPARNKILKKYLKAILKQFGIKPLTDEKTIKRLFKKRKKAKECVAAYVNKNKSCCTLSTKGAKRKKMLCIFYEIELRQAAMDGLDLRDLDKDAVKSCIDTLISVYTADNLRYVNAKMGEKLAKKDKIAADAYDSLRHILRLIDPNLKMPKVEFGQKKKKKKAVGPKMDVKKFKKFYAKKGNRQMLIPIYAHTLAILVGMTIGSKEYNNHMKSVCSVFAGDFAKQFVTAASEYAKAQAK